MGLLGHRFVNLLDSGAPVNRMMKAADVRGAVSEPVAMLPWRRPVLNFLVHLLRHEPVQIPSATVPAM